ncbi:InlB B-repeat-containing protein [Gardnerella leopoldii]|uniref:InlB B-repeat-containing protein n=1 Tax=Gardnerella leopoldii TaxID=2792978 RepID=UPI000DDAE1B3|nr:InlB B-repeat-containing protein [Gardnerella leopoldii]
MAERKDLHGDVVPRRTLRKAHAVKRSRALRKGVAGVAVASTLAMMLPSVVASALQPTQKDIIDASNMTQKMGKGKPDVDELNMQRWGAGVLNKSAQTQKFVELARHDAQMQQLREAQQREIEQREINKSEAKQHESQQQETQQREIDSQLGSSSEQVNFGHSYGTIENAQNTRDLQNLQNAKNIESANSNKASNSVQSATPTKTSEIKNATLGSKSNVAENTVNAVGSAGSAAVSAPAPVQNTNAQPSSTHTENTNTVSNANTTKVRARTSADGSNSASNGSSVAPANNAPISQTAAPADNTTAPSTPVTSTGTEANAGAGTAAIPGADTTAQGNAQVSSAQGQGTESSTQGSQGSAQGSQTNTQGENTRVPGEGKSTTHSASGSTPAPESRSTSSNQPTPSPSPAPTSGTQNAGTTTNNAATDPDSQVIKPNTDNPEAKSTEQANEQVQTDTKPKATYNLQIRYTIGGAANKQLVQPYELTIDQEDFDKLDKDGKYEYIELPQAAGYRPSVYHSGDYQYYIKNDEGKFVIDDGTDADAKRYLRLSKKLITEYAVKKRPAVGANNGAQAPQASSSQTTSQSSSSAQPAVEDGIQYYGELNINYAPKTAKYYVRHLVQDLDNKDEFHDAPNLGVGKTIEVTYKDGKKERIHVTEVTGTVGSDVSAVALYIPGYEPEHNLISSPLSDSEDEKDKLVLNLRYYRKAYEVTYDSAGGTDVTAQKVYYDQEVPAVPEPTYRGHKFLGWQVVKPGDTNQSNTSGSPLIKGNSTNYKMPDHNVRFRAVWEANNTTSYRVNVWVQKADLVDKEHPDSLVNYDFVGLVERTNVQTDSDVVLDKMDDAGVAKDTDELNGKSETDYVTNPELGLTKEELQGTDANNHKDGLISKFNWMNDTPVTSLDGYDTEHPGDANNKGKDLFTRYFHVNKKLTKELNSEEHNLVQGRPDLGKRSKAKLCANDLNNTLNLVYDRNEYELIFAKPAGVNRGDNVAIKRKDENGKTTIYCYAGGGGCSDKYDKKDKDDNDNAINHKGYRVKVRYGQKLTDIWPDVNELYFSEEGKGSLGWQLGFAGDIKYRDTPPYRFTKEEFADPEFRAVFKKDQKDKVAPRISDDPEKTPQTTYELKDNQRLLTADSSDQSQPIQVIIRKQSIASAKKGGTASDDDYELSTDSYSKDDTPNTGYDYPAPSIAGFNPADGYDKTKVGDALDSDDFKDNLEVWYNESHAHGDWDDLSEDEQKAFAKKYHLAFRKYRGVPVDEQENYKGDENEFNDNKPLEFKYDRQSYDVQFYNADGKAISNAKDGAATERLPYEYSLTKRGKKDLTGEDKDLYGKDTSYDDSVTKDNANDTSKQFDGKYTFTLNGKTYSITRPNNLPKDYVFKGWAVDQAGSQLINGESEDAKGESKDKSKAKDITMPVNGIKLYAAWGKPTNIKHTVTFNYNMPNIDGNGNEVAGTNVVKKKEFARYHVIDEKDEIGTPTRKGYDFYGWEINKNGKTLPYAFGNKVVEDITLNAVWVKDTRYKGTFKHIFLKPGYTISDYKNAVTKEAKAAMVDHTAEQTVSGLREHLRYNAEAVYSDETHFPDKHFTSFEASSTESENTGEFIYQTYNMRKYKVRYVTIGKDGKEKELLPESEVSSVNRKYDVVFYKPIEGFKPENTQQRIEYVTDAYGKQKADDIRTITFRYDDVRVLKRKDDYQARPDHYTRYVFKVADGQDSMGSVVDWQNKDVADGSALVYDAIKGTKAYQMPLPTVKAKPGFEFAGWTSKVGSSEVGSHTLQYSDGVNRLPIRSEEQNNPEVIYTANFKIKAPVAIDTKVLKPIDTLNPADPTAAKALITNADEYPSDATFSFGKDEKFDNTPGLHKIKVQVHLDGNIAETEVLYRTLPDLVYGSEWEKFKATDYGSKHKDEYVPITFTGKNDEGTIIGHDGDNSNHPDDGDTTLTAYVYKGKDVRIRVPQAFGKDHSADNYHYVFKGWATNVVKPTAENPNPEQKYDIDSEGRYKDVKVNDNSGITYNAVYKKIEYFSSSSDGGEVPKDAVVAIFKPAPGRLWSDGTSGPKVFYVKKGTDISQITKIINGKQVNVLEMLKGSLTGATGTWKRSSMLNDGKKVTEVKDVADVTGDWKDGWKVNEPFQEFVADQTPWTEPAVQTDYLVAVQDDPDTLPKLTDFITNMPQLKADAAVNNGIEDIKVEYDLPTEAEQNKFKQKMLKKPALYTVPLKVTVKYKDAVDYKAYRLVGRLKVLYQLMYPESLPKNDSQQSSLQTGANAERKLVFDKTKYVSVNFINAQSDNKSPNGKGEFAEGSRELYYAYKQSASGVRAPQVIGKDYDAKGYHYEFQGWEMQAATAPVANSTNTPNITNGTNTAASVVPVVTLVATAAPTPTTVSNPPKIKLYSSAEIAGMKFSGNTTFIARYKLVPNVIDASQQDDIPDGYVATIFLPGFGRTWADGSYKPKLLYIRHGKDKEDNIKFAQKVANDTAAELSGFTKWQMYDAKSRKSNILLHDNWDISRPRIFVAEQNGADGVKIPETVVGVGDKIPNVNKLVHSADPKVSVSVDENAKVDVSKPGISTIMVNVTKPTDEIDKTIGKQKTVTTKLPVHVYVLPNVIADNDLPAKGTAAAKFIEKNYTKVTYVAGKGGSLQKSPLESAGDKIVSVYWVRNGATNLLMPVPDVLADKGYVFKDWSSNTTEKPAALADKRKATEEEREALARMAIMDGMPYVAKLIRNSDKYTLAALQNLLNEAQKQHAAQVYNAKREELAQVAERNHKTDLASEIHQSHDSLQKIKDKLVQNGIDVDKVIEQVHEKTLLVKLAKEAGQPWLAKQISNSMYSSIEALKNLMQEAGIDLTFANLENAIDSYVLDEQREVLAELADEADKPFVAKIIRSSKKSSLEALKQVLRNAGVNPEISLPKPHSKHEITITANFEKMAPMRFKFSGSAREGMLTNFTLQNMTEGSGDATNKITVDGKEVTINELISKVTNSVNGINATCAGTACKISGTPKIVNGKPKVELTFTTTDKYGREAEIAVEIDVISESKPNSPTPAPIPSPAPAPEQPTPVPEQVIPSLDSSTSYDVTIEDEKKQEKDLKETVEAKLELAKTGSDTVSSASAGILSAAIAAIGLAVVKTGKHHRKRRNNK